MSAVALARLPRTRREAVNPDPFTPRVRAPIVLEAAGAELAKDALPGGIRKKDTRALCKPSLVARGGNSWKRNFRIRFHPSFPSYFRFSLAGIHPLLSVRHGGDSARASLKKVQAKTPATIPKWARPFNAFQKNVSGQTIFWSCIPVNAKPTNAIPAQSTMGGIQSQSTIHVSPTMAGLGSSKTGFACDFSLPVTLKFLQFNLRRNGRPSTLRRFSPPSLSFSNTSSPIGGNQRLYVIPRSTGLELLSQTRQRTMQSNLPSRPSPLPSNQVSTPHSPFPYGAPDLRKPRVYLSTAKLVV